MKNFLPLNWSQLKAAAGFTMIELLVVISVIGVLSVAVLSTINPIEQINKGRDTRSRSDAAQLINALDRYFAIHEVYPWNIDTTTEAVAGLGTFTATITDFRDEYEFDEAAAGANTAWAWIQPLVSTAEVKESYIHRMANVTDNTAFYVYKADGANETVYTCFTPSSNAFEQEANTRCQTDTQLSGAVAAACPVDCDDAIGDVNICLVCLP